MIPTPPTAPKLTARYGFNTHGNVIPLTVAAGEPCNVTIIAAMSANQGIGFLDTIPWQLPPDMQQFKRLTMGHVVIVGRTTYESLPVDKEVGYRRLKGRQLVVLSTNPNYEDQLPVCDDVVHFLTLEEAVRRYCHRPQIFIAGGANVYAQAHAFAHDLILTYIDASPEADRYFPMPEQRADYAPELTSSHVYQGTRFKYAYIRKLPK